MLKKRVYISANDPAMIKIVIGRSYIVSDFRGNELPGWVIPLKFERDTQLYKCVSHLGGHVWHKRGEFIREEAA